MPINKNNLCIPRKMNPSWDLRRRIGFQIVAVAFLHAVETVPDHHRLRTSKFRGVSPFNAGRPLLQRRWLQTEKYCRYLPKEGSILKHHRRQKIRKESLWTLLSAPRTSKKNCLSETPRAVQTAGKLGFGNLSRSCEWSTKWLRKHAARDHSSACC